MGRAAVAVAALAVLATPRAFAAPPLSLQLGGEGGLWYQSLNGWLVDDNTLSLRVSFGIDERFAIDGALSEDLEHLEPALHLGGRFRPWSDERWCARWSPYVRAEVALVGASNVFSNYDFTVGVGHWGKFTERLGWFVEVDGIARVGDYDAFALHIAAGLSVSSRDFWR